jgi:ParB family chromosome partitioning protein
VSKAGLPATVKLRHDLHYVEELSRGNRPIGRVIEIDRIQPNPDQPRTEIGDLSELAASIREKGVLEPLIVLPNHDGTYMIIAGERRWRASQIAGLSELPCIEVDTDERGVAEIALIENLQRKDLNIWEEADGLKALSEKFGYTQDEIARKISKSRTTVTELMSVAGLPLGIRERCREKNINSKSTLLEIARQFDEDAMDAFLDRISSGEAPPTRDEARRAARPERVESPRTSNGDRKPAHTFYFSSGDGNYKIKIDFRDPADCNQNGALRALKKAFDAIKKGDN